MSNGADFLGNHVQSLTMQSVPLQEAQMDARQ